MLKRFVLSLGLVALTFAGCGQASAPPALPSQTAPPAQVNAGPAQLAALKALTERLGVSASQVKLLSTQAIEWPDACLGLPAAGASCAQTVTPGFRIVFEVAGLPYEFHTNQDGTHLLPQARHRWPASAMC
jgi:hypothetical protein